MSAPHLPVVANPDHESMLASDDPVLARNKRLVYDWLREVFEAGHLEFAPKYMRDDYIQHNPLVPTGRQGFVEFFSKVRQPSPVEARAKSSIVAILAERDLVMVAFAREHADPQHSGQTYTTTWFDLFRIEDGKIAEHWDAAVKPSTP